MADPEFISSPSRGGLPARVVPPANFLTEREASEMLGRGRFAAMYVSRGLIEMAATPHATMANHWHEGITRESVDKELAWRENAGIFRKLFRFLSWPLYYL